MSKRERKPTTRLTYDEEKEAKEKVTGAGAALGDIEDVKTKLFAKEFNDVIPVLHQLVFKSKGKAGQQRKNLRLFQGIVYGEDPESERARLVERAAKNTVPVVKDLLDMLCIDRTPSSFDDGKDSKEKMCERLVEFLECPKGVVVKKKPPAKTLHKSLIEAVAKYQLDKMDDPTVADLVKAAEDFVGMKLPKDFKDVAKSLIEGEPAAAEDDEPPAKKAKASDDKPADD